MGQKNIISTNSIFCPVTSLLCHSISIILVVYIILILRIDILHMHWNEYTTLVFYYHCASILKENYVVYVFIYSYMYNNHIPYIYIASKVQGGRGKLRGVLHQRAWCYGRGGHWKDWCTVRISVEDTKPSSLWKPWATPSTAADHWASP